MIRAFVEEQRAPAENQRAIVEREAQVLLPIRLRHGRYGAQVGKDGAESRAGDFRVCAEGHGGIKQSTIRHAADVHRGVEVVS